jgi:hypothetical protein
MALLKCMEFSEHGGCGRYLWLPKPTIAESYQDVFYSFLELWVSSVLWITQKLDMSLRYFWHRQPFQLLLCGTYDGCEPSFCWLWSRIGQNMVTDISACHGSLWENFDGWSVLQKYMLKCIVLADHRIMSVRSLIPQTGHWGRFASTFLQALSVSSDCIEWILLCT